MQFAVAFPFLVIVVLIYNLIVFVSATALGDTVLSVSMMSGAVLSLTIGDLVILLGLLVLFIEVMKSARSTSSTILDHMLSTVVFIVALVEFLIVRQAGTAVFLVITTICLIDVVAGYTVSIRAARRDIAFDNG
ncbi:MAG TPA: hypothetical protein VHR67_00105 [Aestuariivirgaceae bacterium]|jgi:hypothetical protein|nr:hypothetical protein [Aestuariivirgaceae bacterium]